MTAAIGLAESTGMFVLGMALIVVMFIEAVVVPLVMVVYGILIVDDLFTTRRNQNGRIAWLAAAVAADVAGLFVYLPPLSTRSWGWAIALALTVAIRTTAVVLSWYCLAKVNRLLWQSRRTQSA